MPYLNSPEEDILDPDRPICDPHHHLWEHAENPYLLPEFLADANSGHRIESSVFVECLSQYRRGGDPLKRPLGETEFVDGIAAQADNSGTRVAAGIVGFADLLQGDAIATVLDEHRALSPRFVGIRHAAAYDPHPDIRKSHVDPPPQLYLRDDFRAGFALLSGRGLVFDAWLFHPQISELTSLAQDFPDTTIVLDHFGGPLGIGPYARRREEIFRRWQQDIRLLAACPNVVAKLGGLLMPLNGFGFHKRGQLASSDEIVAATGRYFSHTIDCFGSGRCMFESNFPVDRQSCSYPVLWNAFKKMAAAYGAREQDELFRDTAVRVYGLED